MTAVHHILSIAYVMAGLALGPQSAQTPPRDIVLLLSNSQATAQLVTRQRLHKAVAGFLRGLAPADRVALLAYDDSTLAVAPFTELTPQGIEGLVAQLRHIPYTSPYSNAASGIERALYELETHGRNGATKSIVLLGVVSLDTGEPDRDLAFSRWLGEVLVDDARRNGIGIHTIALGDRADKPTLQAIAAQTEAGFYVAEQGPELIPTLATVASALESQTPRQPSRPTQAWTDTPPPIASPTSGGDEGEAPQQTAPPPISTQQPVPGQAPATPSAGTPPRLEPHAPGHGTRRGQVGDGFWRHPVLYTSLASGAIVALLGGLVMVLRRRAQVPATNALPQLILDAQTGDSGALLEDLNGATSHRVHRLGARLTWISATPVEPGEGCGVVLVSNGGVDHKHAIIRRTGAAYWISNQRASRGTYVNDEPVDADQERRLAHGDLLRVGDAVFRFRNER